ARVCEILGYSLGELLQMKSTLLTYQPTPDAQEMFARRLAEVRLGKTLRYERLARRKDGSPVPIEVSLRQLENGFIQAIYRDVTERKRIEESVRRNDAYLAEAQRLGRTGSWAGTSPPGNSSTGPGSTTACTAWTRNRGHRPGKRHSSSFIRTT